MAKWSETTLGELVRLQRGYDLTAEERVEGTVPVMGAAGQNGFHNVSRTSGPGVVIGRSGGSYGKTHFCYDDFWPHNTSMFVTDFMGNDPYFVFYLLKLLNFDALNSGSAQPSLNRNYLYPVKAMAPQSSEQPNIIAVIRNIDNKIEINNQISAELEAIAKLIYGYWFIQFDFPTENGAPYKSSGGKMVWCDQLKREIPEGWGSTSLWDIAKYFNGLAMQKHRPTGSAYLPVIKIREMSGGFSNGTEKAKPSVPKAAVIEDGDILFSWSATLDVMVWAGGRGALNQHIFKVTSCSHPRSWVYFQLRNYLSHFKMMADKRKTTMGHITQDHLKQSCVISVPKEQLKSFDDLVEPILEQQVQLRKQNQELANLRDWLLPLLMSGQVEVEA